MADTIFSRIFFSVAPTKRWLWSSLHVCGWGLELFLGWSWHIYEMSPFGRNGFTDTKLDLDSHWVKHGAGKETFFLRNFKTVQGSNSDISLAILEWAYTRVDKWYHNDPNLGRSLSNFLSKPRKDRDFFSGATLLMILIRGDFVGLKNNMPIHALRGSYLWNHWSTRWSTGLLRTVND